MISYVPNTIGKAKDYNLQDNKRLSLPNLQGNMHSTLKSEKLQFLVVLLFASKTKINFVLQDFFDQSGLKVSAEQRNKITQILALEVIIQLQPFIHMCNFYWTIFQILEHCALQKLRESMHLLYIYHHYNQNNNFCCVVSYHHIVTKI